jgi:hypothetical protein
VIVGKIEVRDEIVWGVIGEVGIEWVEVQGKGESDGVWGGGD